MGHEEHTVQPCADKVMFVYYPDSGEWVWDNDIARGLGLSGDIRYRTHMISHRETGWVSLTDAIIRYVATHIADDVVDFHGVVPVEDEYRRLHTLSLGLIRHPIGRCLIGVVRNDIDIGGEYDIDLATRYRLLTELSPDGVLVHVSGRIVFANAAVARLVHVDNAADLVGKSVLPFLDKPVALEMSERTSRLRKEGDSVITESVNLYAEDGRVVPVNVTAVRTTWGGEVAYQVILHDISDKKAMERLARQEEEALRWQAVHDSLTGLPNRLGILHHLEGLIAEQRGGAVIFLDLDRFKSVNDTLGHAAGDTVLLETAQHLRAIADSYGDTVGRLSGDEFIIVCSGYKDEAALSARAVAYMKAVSTQVDTGTDRVLTITASLGISLVEPGTGRAAEVIQQADMAMFRAKENGRDRYVWYDEQIKADVVRQAEMIQDLRSAVCDDQFYVVYQPIVDLRTNRLVGVEALLRWEHPQRGLISPAEFIPIAESGSLIIPIGDSVLRRACQDIAQAMHEGMCPPDFRFSVNLSARQLLSEGLVGRVSDLLSETGLNPESLTFEITESTAMEGGEASLTVLRSLKDIGVGIAIDDFGTGYSSLARLREMPIDVLKIDKSFIDDICIDKRSADVTTAIVRLGTVFGLSICVEGVETQDQVAALRSLGCTTGQGFYFSKPVSLKQALASLTY